MLSREQIQTRSYQIWEREGRPNGHDVEHWRRAEAELIAELQRLHAEAADFVAQAEPKAKSPKKAKAASKGEAPVKKPRKKASAADRPTLN